MAQVHKEELKCVSAMYGEQCVTTIGHQSMLMLPADNLGFQIQVCFISHPYFSLMHRNVL